MFVSAHARPAAPAVTALAAARAGGGAVLAAGYSDGALRLWSLYSQACLLHMAAPVPRRLCFAPDARGGGTLVAQAHPRTAVPVARTSTGHALRHLIQ